MTILTGYINIKKENLKTDLNNETITKDDYDISLSELELKQKYEIGKTFKIIQHPQRHYNRPFKLKRWFIDIDIPEGLGYLLYNSNTNTWDFLEEFVIDSESSSCCTKYKTIKAIQRAILKWKLPVGTIVTCTGKYIENTYKFKII